MLLKMMSTGKRRKDKDDLKVWDKLRMGGGLRVLVVGAGAAGLCVARHALAEAAVSEVVVLEGSRRLGGTWAYEEHAGLDPLTARPMHAAMYANMRTNLPKEVMGFPDFPFPAGEASFLGHAQVQAYLESYAEHFALLPTIRFATLVVRLAREKGGWRLWSKSLAGAGGSKSEVKPSSELFDAAFVCNGHYAHPHTPSIPGAEIFAGESVHSHSYRHPQSFQGKRVAVLGAGPSGTDIALDIAPCAKQVYLCHDHEPLSSVLPDNVEQRKGFARFSGPHSLLLKDESTLQDVEAVIYCTGYKYDFPFLDQKALGLEVSPLGGVSPLYQHLLFIPDPSLIFIGLAKIIVPFPQFDAQALFSLWHLKNPEAIGRPEMEEWLAKDTAFRAEALPTEKNQHLMGPLQWAYNEELCRLAGIPSRIAPVVFRLYDEVHRYRVKNLCTYKNERFTILNSDSFQHVF